MAHNNADVYAFQVGDGDFGNIVQSVQAAAFTIKGAALAADFRPPPMSIFLRPIPEPSTWALMLVGFRGLALAAYRRRTRSRAA